MLLALRSVGALRPLEHAATIPERVRSACDMLTEGVVVLDVAGQNMELQRLATTDPLCGAISTGIRSAIEPRDRAESRRQP